VAGGCGPRLKALTAAHLATESQAAKCDHLGSDIDEHSIEPDESAGAIGAGLAGWEDPIIIVGYSLGAVSMADRLSQAGVPVKLVVTLDPIRATKIRCGNRLGTVRRCFVNSSNGRNNNPRPADIILLVAAP
jgi:hypothetical protein